MASTVLVHNKRSIYDPIRFKSNTKIVHRINASLKMWSKKVCFCFTICKAKKKNESSSSSAGKRGHRKRSGGGSPPGDGNGAGAAVAAGSAAAAVAAAHHASVMEGSTHGHGGAEGCGGDG